MFLQGPHGAFFSELAQSLKSAGARVSRVGFNQGDAHFWPDRTSYIPFRAPMEDWRAQASALLDGVTDLVLYGDTRPHHATAIDLANARGITVHCFEEGYLRPYWITYERGGTNGNSDLMRLGQEEMARALETSATQLSPAPAQWGPMWHHTWAGCRYHFNILWRNQDYPHYRSHRAQSVRQELGLHLRRLALFPFDSLQRRIRTRRLLHTGVPYHLVLLQLGHDASVRDHSNFASIGTFTDQCIAAFAKSAPKHHHLVLKAHPLEDGREPLEARIFAQADALGVADRVQYIQGGKLGQLLDRAFSALTINSTAGQQALWRGLPLKAFGRGVYCRSELVSDQPLAEFFQRPTPPDQAAYRVFRQFLLETSQVSGGYYTKTGRANARRQVVDLMLDPLDPYARRLQAARQTNVAKLHIA